MSDALYGLLAAIGGAVITTAAAYWGRCKCSGARSMSNVSRRIEIVVRHDSRETLHAEKLRRHGRRRSARLR